MNVTYIEFGWGTEMGTARRVVMERLATVPVPPGIRPLMTPQTSIMGQILHTGLHRRTGPRGGDIAVVDQTGLVAERGAGGVPTSSAVWQVRDRNDPQSWERVAAEKLAWGSAAPERTARFVWKGRTRTATFATPPEARMELRTITDWLVRPRLLKLPGIAEVIVMGGDKKQYQVLVGD